MEPMNQFLNSHRQEFKDFVDAVCAISPDRSTSAIPPSYATPITILQRLPGPRREGFPSLPYLIDQARECAGLVNLWLEFRNDIDTENPMSEELKRFNALCEQSHQKTKDCVQRTERAERTSGSTEPNWEELSEQMGRKARIRTSSDRFITGTSAGGGGLRTGNMSMSSLNDAYFGRKTPLQDSPTYNKRPSTAADTHDGRLTAATEGSESSDDDTGTPPVSASAIWDPGPGTNNDDESMSTLAVKDEEGDLPEVPEPAIGSSIYSLGTNPSDKLAKSSRYPTHHHRKRDKTTAKSTYSLDKPSLPHDRIGPAKGQGHRERAGSSSGTGTGKSLYRLKDMSADVGRRSPTSRDGAGSILRVGDLGGLFKRKIKDREDGWRG